MMRNCSMPGTDRAQRDGPRVVDVPGVMQTAAVNGAFDGAAHGLDDDLRRGPTPSAEPT